MNKIYRLIKNRNTGMVQVAPEIARAHGKGKGMVKVGTLAVVLACASPSAWAAELMWVNTTTGDWFTGGNWSSTTVPLITDNVNRIDNGGTAQVQVAGAVANNVTIGYSNTGNLAISADGTLNSAGAVLMGREVGSVGIATVDGTGSSWDAALNFTVGRSGTGTLTVSNGGSASSVTGFVFGSLAGSTGTASVTGAGSSLTVSNGQVVVGSSGSGTLNIADSGIVNVSSGNGLWLASNVGSSGTLNIGTGGAAGILNAVKVEGRDGTATLNFNHTDGAYHFTRDGTSTGTAVNITGSTAVNHNGSGTTTLSGANTYSGDTYINAGKLLVNGSLTGNTFVNSGATLGGSGSLGHVTVNSGGTLSPGNSPGILSVTGDLVLTSGSTTVMEIDGPTPGTEHDQINVTGTATLDGTLDLRFSYVPDIGTTYNLLNAGSFVLAGDPVTGFDPVIDNLRSNLGAALRVTPMITATEYDILIEQLSFIDAAGGPLTRNQGSVAANLNGLVSSGRATELFDALNMLPAEQLADAYDSLSGVQHSHSLPQAMRASRQFTQVIGERLGWGGSNTNTADASRLGIVQLAYNGDDMAGLLEAPKPSEAFWLRALGGFGDIDSDGNGAGADYRSSGVALGHDRQVRSDLLAGVAFGYTRSDVDMHAGGSDIDSYQLAVYGRQQGDNTYLDATLGLGHHRINSARAVQFTGFSGTARADYRIHELGLSLEAGRYYALSDTHRLTPFAGLQYGHYRQNGFSESGAGDANLRFDDARMDSLRSVVGARINSVLRSSGGMRFDTTAGLAWVHEHLDSEASLNPAFAVNGNVPFTVDGPAADRDRAQASLGVSAQLSKRTQLDLAYHGEFADSEQQHGVAATFRVRW